MFANACRQSTDFHFLSIDEQLDSIRGHAAALSEERSQGLHGDDESRNLIGSSMGSRQHSIGATPDRSREPSTERLVLLIACICFNISLFLHIDVLA